MKETKDTVFRYNYPLIKHGVKGGTAQEVVGKFKVDSKCP